MTSHANAETPDARRTIEEGSRKRRTPLSRQRIRNTPNGLVRLTPTQMQILSFLAKHEGNPCSKSQIAAAIGRNEKTVDRLLSQMRRNGIVISEPMHSSNGAQLPNVYRLTRWAQPY